MLDRRTAYVGNMQRRLSAPALLVLALVAPGRAPAKPASRYAPIAQGVATSEHAPFLMGECSSCHQRDGVDPGPLRKTLPSLCLDCHDDFATRLPKRMEHARPPVNCGACHTPHNSEKANLLL